MGRLETQVDRRRYSVCAEEGVGKVEEGVGAAVETFVERAAKGAESIGRFHDAPIMHSPTALRTSYLPSELKRKLSLVCVLGILGGGSACTGAQRLLFL